MPLNSDDFVQYADAMQVWDLGGQANLRPSWATYYRATDAVIVVIDSTDRARSSIAKVRLGCLVIQQAALVSSPLTIRVQSLVQASHCRMAMDKAALPDVAATHESLLYCLQPPGAVRHSPVNVICPILQAELFTLLEHEHLQTAAILIMANKQDLKDAMNVKEMTDVLSLHTLKRHDWHIQVKDPFSDSV